MAAGDPPTAAATKIRYASPQGRWVIAAAVLGSGVAFLDSTVVNVALPAIGADFHTSISGLQWTVDAYLVTLSALLLFGGSLGDRFGRRRVFVIGLVWFTVASMFCGVAPSAGFLNVARAVQGVGGALLVPGSLAIIAATFDDADRGRAVGRWSGLAGVASSAGPLVGGWLIDSVSWRLIFFLNLPLAAAAGIIAVRHVPETRAPGSEPLDVVGALLVTLALGALAYAAIERSAAAAPWLAVLGVVLLVAFMMVERHRGDQAMLPLSLFRSRQFTGANLTTLLVYAGLGGALFLVVLRLQVSLGYSALEAGLSLLPLTIVMLFAAPAAGELGQRIGPRLPMTIGPIVAGLGLLWLAAVSAGDQYVTAVLPGMVVFSAGMALTVAPLTSAVFASVDDAHDGVASGVNNAVSRLAGLIAVAVLPGLAGISTGSSLAASLEHGYGTAMAISAFTCAAGGVIAFVTVRKGSAVDSTVHPAVTQACQSPCLAVNPGSEAA
jgi:EmrB/QacA subfamily drug resistance transporter